MKEKGKHQSIMLLVRDTAHISNWTPLADDDCVLSTEAPTFDDLPLLSFSEPLPKASDTNTHISTRYSTNTYQVVQHRRLALFQS